MHDELSPGTIALDKHTDRSLPVRGMSWEDRQVSPAWAGAPLRTSQAPRYPTSLYPSLHAPASTGSLPPCPELFPQPRETTHNPPGEGSPPQSPALRSLQGSRAQAGTDPKATVLDADRLRREPVVVLEQAHLLALTKRLLRGRHRADRVTYTIFRSSATPAGVCRGPPLARHCWACWA